MINRHPAIDRPPAVTVFSRGVRHLITTLRYYRSGRWHLGNDCNSIRFGRALGEITTRRRVHADDMWCSWWRKKSIKNVGAERSTRRVYLGFGIPLLASPFTFFMYKLRPRPGHMHTSYVPDRATRTSCVADRATRTSCVPVQAVPGDCVRNI